MKEDFQYSKFWFKTYKEATCIIVRDEEVLYTSSFQGVKPLRLYFQEHGKSQYPLMVVDKIMGKAAVMLAILCGAKKLMTPVISELGLEYAKKHDVLVAYEKRVDYIINRAGDGPCPIEASVEHIDDLEAGYQAIEDAIAELMKAR